jgi:hypothetical protein
VSCPSYQIQFVRKTSRCKIAPLIIIFDLITGNYKIWDTGFQ